MNIILLGAPGAGKGTQAELISKNLSCKVISMGDIIRNTLKSGTEIGNKAKELVNQGKLLADDIVIEIVKNRLKESDVQNGFILDGFPRTIPQAEALDKIGITINKVLCLEVKDEVITKRMSGRRICPNCGRVYHIDSKKPKVNGICDICSSTLVQRDDDQPDTVKNRLKVYHEQTEPLKDYYKKQNKLVIVEGQEEVKDTFNLVKNAIEA